ncbi:sensor histidine kinase [Chitinophaga horti]|uniref:Sensor histidine kinase n=1 Tax=Chitinophaga horti TaxID=2920382 RepID=A0ABY6J325_9BACT|nr:sensor histidine kinase [Chitinophaga horti]UYQ94068.1 sensor histidine kinase [Chitinophaga horti]
MKLGTKNILEQKWLQELIILVFTFVLFSMNDWVLITTWVKFWKGCVYFLVLYSHAQINRFLLLPILLKQHKPLVYTLSAIILALIFAGVLHGVADEWLYKNCYLYKSVKQDTYLYHLATIVATFICVMGPVLLLRYYREQKKKGQEQKLIAEMQLDLLRSQLNPHFLFNTFNTLYGISLQFPKRAPDLIMQVSTLMRYQLDSSQKEMVPLNEELSFIESYIMLEKERIGYRCDIGYHQDIDVEGDYRIAPMLLIAFVENAFKHGTGAIDACFVHIFAEVKDRVFSFRIVNSIPKKKAVVPSTKIGIRNTIERLNILYAGQYELEIGEQGEEYIVDFKLRL